MKTVIILSIFMLVFGCAGEEAINGPQSAPLSATQTMHFEYVGSDCEDVNLLCFVDYTDGRPVTQLFHAKSGKVESFSLDVILPDEAFQINIHLHHSQSVIGTILDMETPVGYSYVNLLQPGCFNPVEMLGLAQEWTVEDCLRECLGRPW